MSRCACVCACERLIVAVCAHLVKVWPPRISHRECPSVFQFITSADSLKEKKSQAGLLFLTNHPSSLTFSVFQQWGCRPTVCAAPSCNMHQMSKWKLVFNPAARGEVQFLISVAFQKGSLRNGPCLTYKMIWKRPAGLPHLFEYLPINRSQRRKLGRNFLSTEAQSYATHHL